MKHPFPLEFEEWKPITDKSVPNIADNYMVSSLGRIISYRRVNPVYLKPVPTWNGYYRVPLALKNKTVRYYLIHRIVMIEFYPLYNYKNLQVNHIDGCKDNNTLPNLEWCTGSENIIHAIKNGLKSTEYGGEIGNSSITIEQAQSVCEYLSTNMYTCNQISKILNIPQQIVANIKDKVSWTWLSDKYNINFNNTHKGANSSFTEEEFCNMCIFFENNNPSKYEDIVHYYIAAMNSIGRKYDQSYFQIMNGLYNHTIKKEYYK